MSWYKIGATHYDALTEALNDLEKVKMKKILYAKLFIIAYVIEKEPWLLVLLTCFHGCFVEQTKSKAFPIY